MTSAGSRGTRGRLLAPILSAAFLLSATPALASDGHAFSTSFNGGTEAEPGLAAPQGVAINQSTGNVYVVDSPASEVQTLTVNATGGTFKLTFEGQTTAALPFNATSSEVTVALRNLSKIGSGNVKATGGPGATAPYTIAFSGALAEKRLPQIAASAASLTPAGSTATTAIATVGGPGNDVAEFSEAGALIRTFGSKGTGDGQFENPTEIAVANAGPNQGDVYVLDGGGTSKGANRVEVFSETGAYLSQVKKEEFQAASSKDFNYEGPNYLEGLGLDSGGNLWVFSGDNLLFELPVGGSLEGVTKFQSVPGPGFLVTPGPEFRWTNGSGATRFGPGGENLGGFGFSESPSGTGLAVDLKSGHEGFYLDRGTVVAHFPVPASNAKGGPYDTFGSGTLEGGAGIAVNEANGKVYVADSKRNRVDVFAATILPTAALEAATGIAQTSAILHGTVNPEGLSVSACQFEYWRSGHEAEKQTASCSPTPGSGSSPVAVSAALSGLAPKTEYVFRLIATNANGTSTANEEKLKFKTLAPLLPLTVTKAGAGEGTVESLAPHTGINCGLFCSAEFEEGSEVELKATPAIGSEFTGWSGAGCSGTGACKVKMSAAEEVTATFVKEGPLAFHKLAVSVTGEGEVSAGSGTISGCTSSGGPSCEGEYEEDAHVLLTETPGSNAEFAGWGTPQCDESTQSTCEIAIGSGDEAVAASFKPKPKPKFKLTVSKTGSGQGTLTSTPAGINCGTGAGCEAEYEEGVEVELHQSPAAGSEFKEWSGACAGAATCKVAMSAAKAVGAVFAPIPRTLSITKAGTGTGEVKCKANGGSAGACAASYPNATAVELIATANAGSSFAGFSAATGSAASCATSPCAFTIEANSAVTATFNVVVKPKFKLTVSKTGSGQGTVTSTPAGINCGTGAGCEAEYEEGVEVELHQSPASGSEFKEWTGACAGAGTCKVTMSAAKAVGAVFAPIPRTLAIAKAGTGTGEVKCKANGGSAGACAASYPNATSVELIATANAGSSFAGFSAATGSAASCAASPCAFTIEANSAVTATFNLIPKLKFTLKVKKTGSGSGKVESTSPLSPKIACGSECEAEFEEGTKVTLARSADPGSKFIEWSGACTGAGTCEVTMSAAKEVSARFDLAPKFKLTVSKPGAGAGKVTSTPAGIDCGATCSAEYEEGKEGGGGGGGGEGRTERDGLGGL